MGGLFVGVASLGLVLLGGDVGVGVWVGVVGLLVGDALTGALFMSFLLVSQGLDLADPELFFSSSMRPQLLF